MTVNNAPHPDQQASTVLYNGLLAPVGADVRASSEH